MGSACALLTELRHFTTTPPALPPSQHCDCVNNVWLLGIRDVISYEILIRMHEDATYPTN